MGQDDFNTGALVMFMWLGTIALSVFSGVLAWDWVEPESFFGAIGFLIVWGIFSKIGHFLMFGVIYLLFDKN
jgi:hypothetical protein